jgi:hypothetical protein
VIAVNVVGNGTMAMSSNYLAGEEIGILKSTESFKLINFSSTIHGYQ